MHEYHALVRRAVRAVCNSFVGAVLGAAELPKKLARDARRYRNRARAWFAVWLAGQAIRRELRDEVRGIKRELAHMTPAERHKAAVRLSMRLTSLDACSVLSRAALEGSMVIGSNGQLQPARRGSRRV